MDMVVRGGQTEPHINHKAYNGDGETLVTPQQAKPLQTGNLYI